MQGVRPDKVWGLEKEREGLMKCDRRSDRGEATVKREETRTTDSQQIGRGTENGHD
jgi:hypothetical protein